MKHFLSTFIPNLLRSFSLRNMRWHIIAIVLTYVIVMRNFDWAYFLAMRGPTFAPYESLFFSAVIIGAFLPILLPVFLIFIGSIFKHKKISVMGWALGQAALLGSIISSFYKAITGRIQPNLNDLRLNISHEFNFGFLHNGIFWGWPSSHTTIAFAMSCTLIALFPKHKLVLWGALLYAFYIGIGVSTNIHWFSEFVAGAIIGAVIGTVVGKSFHRTLIGS